MSRRLRPDPKHVRRPGKNKGHSGTIGLKSDTGNELFCCFTSSAHPFTGPTGGRPCTTYTRVGVYTALHHGGNYQAAYAALEKDGFGKKNPEKAQAPMEWDAPIPLDPTLDIPAFPIDRLPWWLAAWVKAVSQAMQVPAELPALLALAFVGAGIAGVARVEIRPGWREPCNIFTVTALPPGDRKSGVFALALAPIAKHEAEQLEQMKPLIAEAEAEKRILDKRLAQAESIAAKELDVEKARQDKQCAQELAKQAEAFQVPVAPQFFTDDVTSERLGQLMAQQSGRMLLASAEGTIFELAKGRYSEAANFDIYLKGHAGDPYRCGRITRDDDVIEKPALSVALAVQPDVIRGLADQAIMKGRGFLARFLYAMPTSWVGSRQVRPTPVPAKVEADYNAKMMTLWSVGYQAVVAKREPEIYPFSPAADDAMAEFERWLEPQLGEDQALGCLAGWANKLPGAIARLAMIFHAAEGNSAAQISAETVNNAIAIARDFLLPHALAAFQAMGADPRLAKARAVAKWFMKDGLVEFTRRDVHVAHRAAFPVAEDIQPVLDLLAQHFYIRLKPAEPKPGAGRKPSPVYEVNPALFLADAE